MGSFAYRDFGVTLLQVCATALGKALFTVLLLASAYMTLLTLINEMWMVYYFPAFWFGFAAFVVAKRWLKNDELAAPPGALLVVLLAFSSLMMGDYALSNL